MQPRVVARSAGRRFLITLVVLVALAAIGGTSMVSAGQDQLARVRAATSTFHSLAVAETAGYGEFYMCTDHVSDGTMGQHYVNLDLVLDTATGVPTIDPLAPEALVYEPKINGGYRLVGVEYVVFQDAWDAANDAPPALFGKTFTLIPAGNRYDLPPFYELPRLDLAPQPERNLQGLEPEGHLPRPGRPGLDHSRVSVAATRPVGWRRRRTTRGPAPPAASLHA